MSEIFEFILNLSICIVWFFIGYITKSIFDSYDEMEETICDN